MWKNNKYLNYLCIGVVIFSQIISGFLQQVNLLPHLNKEHEHLNNLHKSTLHLCVLLNLTGILSGFSLLFAVILRQTKLVLCHITMNAVCAVVVLIYFVVVVCLKKLVIDLVFDSLLITTAVYTFVCFLEYSVYLYYKEMLREREKEHDVTELVTNECVT
ncbi:hypothetical protein Zmor_009476 [Zophobas morio]|uniref:Uncharacterized protein n=1 Tax=Zophobas morio TaxID=2755281 RepID=A0AA38IQS5_9CUCU|nr:hypothetical protein Zmor_009476 [Zophobas morio]